ncbi:MAG: YkgJ family cysteine cluster protein [Desulfuromonas sp.]|nr:YkgJ family cysteine cluster protein [Desulfuromonas sp.]
MTSTKHQNITHNWHDLQQQMHAQQQFLNLMIAQCRSEYLDRGGSIYCHSGCGGCCTLHVHCLYTEAIDIAQTLDAQQTQQITDYAMALQQLAQSTADLKTFLRHSRDQLGNCPFLDTQNRCSIYRLRPLACRALLSTKEPHYCELDFATLNSAEKQEFMASLDRSAVNFPTHYLAAPQRWGSEAEQLQHAAMLKSFGIAISGSLPYLVFIEQRYTLSKIIVQGATATLNFLSQHQLDIPLLLQVQVQSHAE